MSYPQTCYSLLYACNSTFNMHATPLMCPTLAQHRALVMPTESRMGEDRNFTLTFCNLFFNSPLDLREAPWDFTCGAEATS